MGIFDRILGMEGPRRATPDQGAAPTDEQAIARYRYLLETAPPEAIEQAHAEAFARLTPEQRRTVLQQLAAEMPGTERAAAERAGDEPKALARVATRAEIRQPGSIERAFGRMGGAAPGMGIGGLMAGSFLGSMAGTVLGTAIAQNLFGHHGFGAADAAPGGEHATHDETSADASGDSDSGGDFDAGGDFDGGSFDV